MRRLMLSVVAAAGFCTALVQGAATASAGLLNLRVVNYAPVNQPVYNMWANWQPSIVQSDLAKIASLHANAVRVFTPEDTCYPGICATDQQELNSFVSMATGLGLRVWLTMYPWSQPSAQDGMTYAQAVIGQFKGRTDLIAALEVYNEIIPNNWPTGWQDWARQVLPAARADSGGIPVTISAGGGDNPPNTNFQNLVTGLAGVGVQPDFYNYHYYYDGPSTQTNLNQTKSIAGAVPVDVEETGISTDCYAGPFNTCSSVPTQFFLCGTTSYAKRISGPTQEANQATYFDQVEQGTLAAGLGAAGVWTLNDQPYSCSYLYPHDLFGLYRADGSAKPAASHIKQDFINAGG